MVALRSDSMLIFFARLSWMMFGPGVLLVSTVLIVSSPRAGWRTGADIVYWVALAGMILGRYVEFRGGDPRTSTGEPANLHDLRRYSIVTAIVGSVVWVVTNVISNYALE